MKTLVDPIIFLFAPSTGTKEGLPWISIWRLRKLLGAAVLMFFSSTVVWAQSADSTGEKQSLFNWLDEQGEILNIKLRTDFAALANAGSTELYQSATFFLLEKRREVLETEIEVRPRGKYRRKVCSFPPLKLKFPKKDLKEKGWAKHNTLKLVVHCYETDWSDEMVLREYLAYKLFQHISPVALKVKLAKVTYEDTAGKFPKTTHYGFLIEDDEELADRLDGKLIEDFNLPAERVDFSQYAIQAVFQYMIGNADWSVALRRNVELVRRKSDDQVLIVPYDFDYSGLVNPPYARPNPDFNQKTVRDRNLIGFPMSDAQKMEVIERFRPLQDQFIATCKSFKTLSPTARRDVIKYITSFYEVLEKDPSLPAVTYPLSW